METTKNVKPKVKKGFWKPEEDLVLKQFVETHGEGNWATLAKKSGLTRSAKSCRLRWKNYLSPNIKRGTITEDEKDLIVRMHKLLGNRWSLIAGRIPGRTDNEIKNYWNTHLNKKFRPVKNAHTKSTATGNKSSPSIHHQLQNVALCCSAEEDVGNRVSDSSVLLDTRNNTTHEKDESALPACEDVAFFYYNDECFAPILDDLVLFEAFDAKGLPPIL